MKRSHFMYAAFIAFTFFLVYLSLASPDDKPLKNENKKSAEKEVVSKEIMLKIIKTNNDPNQAKLLWDYTSWHDCTDTITGRIAYKRWVELMTIKIDKITDPEEAYNIYMTTFCGSVPGIAHKKWVELGGVRKFSHN